MDISDEMRYRILCIGKIKEHFFRDIIGDICVKMKKTGNELEIIEMPDIKIPDNLSESKKEAFLERECEQMKKRIEKSDYVIALCIEGKEMSTKKHKELTSGLRFDGKSSVTYIIGGSLGLPKWVKDRADVKMSFSKMTFPHQLMRVVLCEEILKICS